MYIGSINILVKTICVLHSFKADPLDIKDHTFLKEINAIHLKS